MHTVLVQKPLGKSHLEDPGVDWVIILKYSLKKRYGRAWTGLSWLRIGKRGGLFKHGSGSSNSIKCGKFFKINFPDMHGTR